MIGVVSILVLAYILYAISLAIYRLCFHPLSKYPGPKIAAISRWHEFYYDVVLKGRFSAAVEEYHDQYGPIVRITPDELHIRDSKFYEDFYTKHGRGNKMAALAARFGTELCTFSTPDAQLHALRRSAITPYFSRQRMIAFEKGIRDKAALLVRNISRLEKSKQIFNIQSAWTAYVGDVITLYSFSFDLDHLNSDKFESNFLAPVLTMSLTGPLAAQFPVVPKIMMSLPDALVARLNPVFARLHQFQNGVRAQVRRLNKVEHKEKNKDIQSYDTILKSMLDNPDLPPSEKEEERLVHEAVQFIAAGLLTTSWSLTVGSYFIANNPEIYRKLREELDKTIPDPSAPNAFSWTELEKLPYLTGCIKESIRLAYPVSGRSPREWPTPVRYKDWVIPAGTAISMTLADVLKDDHIFEDHEAFKPERWIGNSTTKHGEPIEKYFVPFSKGVRACVGINLAWCELYLGMAAVFRNFKFELFETDYSDIEIVHDFFTPYPRLDSKGVRVKCV